MENTIIYRQKKSGEFEPIGAQLRYDERIFGPGHTLVTVDKNFIAFKYRVNPDWVAFVAAAQHLRADTDRIQKIRQVLATDPEIGSVQDVLDYLINEVAARALPVSEKSSVREAREWYHTVLALAHSEEE